MTQTRTQLNTAQPTRTSPSLFDSEDRYCRHCGEVGLVFDPSAAGPRCRDCGELA